VHSSRDDKNAAEVVERSRELRARPSIAAQKEVKKSVRGARIYRDKAKCINKFIFIELGIVRTGEGMVESMITIVG
jgi:hypothetical protein